MQGMAHTLRHRLGHPVETTIELFGGKWKSDILGALGFDVLISRFEPYYQLAEYLAGYTDGLIGLAIGFCSGCWAAGAPFVTYSFPLQEGWKI